MHRCKSLTGNTDPLKEHWPFDPRPLQYPVCARCNVRCSDFQLRSSFCARILLSFCGAFPPLNYTKHLFCIVDTVKLYTLHNHLSREIPKNFKEPISDLLRFELSRKLDHIIVTRLNVARHPLMLRFPRLGDHVSVLYLGFNHAVKQHLNSVNVADHAPLTFHAKDLI